MKHKFEVCQIIVNFLRFVKNQFGKSIKKIWSNNGIEYVNFEFSKFVIDQGIIHEITYVNTPQQKKVTKQKNCHLLEVSKALLSQMYVPNVYWEEIVLIVTYLINRLLTCVSQGISSIEHIFLLYHVFECVAFVYSHNPNCGKLDPGAFNCIFIGYPSNIKESSILCANGCHLSLNTILLCQLSISGKEYFRSQVYLKVIICSVFVGCPRHQS
ncbi:hypothetical protein CR513_31928, partial [Mucuna pruriens]